MKIFVCLTCKKKGEIWEAITYDMALEHAQQEHPDELSSEGAENLISIENLDNQTIIDIVTEGQPEENAKKKKQYPYPYAPYYTDGQTYSCSKCNLNGSSVDDFYVHLMQTHPLDFKPFLQRWCEDKILSDRKKNMPSAEPITKEQCSKWATEKVNAILYKLELQKGSKDFFVQYLSAISLPSLKEFVEGKTYCPYCGLTQETFMLPDLTTQYKEKMILQELSATNANMQGKSISDLYKVTFAGQWMLENIHLNFLNNLHLSLVHPEHYRQVIKDKILKGNLPMFLAYFGEKPVKEELVLGISVSRAVSNEVASFWKWITPKRKQ